MTEEPLKPCPFCGIGEPELRETIMGTHRVKCEYCEAMGGPSPDKYKAIAAWNRRV